MADPVLAAIHRQKAASCLFALRVILRRQGKWSDERHNAAYLTKEQELEARWK